MHPGNRTKVYPSIVYDLLRKFPEQCCYFIVTDDVSRNIDHVEPQKSIGTKEGQRHFIRYWPEDRNCHHLFNEFYQPATDSQNSLVITCYLPKVEGGDIEAASQLQTILPDFQSF